MNMKNHEAHTSISQLESKLIECQKALAEMQEAEKGLRLSEEKFRLMFENSDDLVLHVDREGIVIDANPKIEDLTGHSRSEMIGEHFVRWNVYKSDSKEIILKLFEEAVRHDTTFTREVELIYADGRSTVVMPSTNMIKRDGQVEGILVLMKDITERKRSEEKLAELYKLERDLRQQIEAEMNRRVDFSRTLAHELKTPLTPVLASIDSLLSELHDDRLQNLARSISRGANNLNRRINELLDLEKGEIGMLELDSEPTDLLSILRDAIDSILPMAISRGQSLHMDAPLSLPAIQADESRIQQVLLNLLSNAIRFTPPNGKITVKARESKGSVIVEVKDTGPGMSKTQLAQVFEPYRRLSGDRVHSGGLGLGLALCRTLVELHGGEIWVHSHPGKGATFSFSLPVTHTITQSAKSVPSQKLWKILMIEDDPEIVDAVELAFQRDWPEVEWLSAPTGRKGLELLESENPDIVVLDLGLPDMDGLEILRSIRLFSPVPVVVLSVRQEESAVTRALELGANDYITKPFRKMELLSRLKVQLRGSISTDAETPIMCGVLRLDPATFQLKHGNRDINLTIIEGRIMRQLMLNAGNVVTYSRLTEAIWGGDTEDTPDAIRSLRVHIRCLRRKVETDPGKPKLIRTKSGVGYWLARPD